MIKEMKIQSPKWSDPLTSLYFGGGTPSVLSVEEFSKLYKGIEENFNISQLIELTLECNPEDLSEEKLELWKGLGINRLSIGNQSFQDDILKRINRQHSLKDSLEGIARARKIGFDNISIDVIIGLPGLSTEILLKDLNTLVSLNPEHISAYQLSVEEKTTLAHQLKKGVIAIPDEKEINAQFLLVDEFLVANGYLHYEVSNYAKEGYEAKHNSSYWSGDSYLGIGPGAHSYKEDKRDWNVSNNNAYIKALSKEEDWFEGESLSDMDRFNEQIMTSLRIKKGLDLSKLKKDFPHFYTDEINRKVEVWEKNNWALLSESTVQLNMNGWLISDNLASDLFVI